LAGLLFFAHKAGWIAVNFQIIARDQPGLYAVSQFVDGDTIAVNMNGQTEKVRFIGVDTPETHKPNTPVQCYGPQAAAFTKATIGNGRVRLVSDSLSTDRDRYGRLLRYVYLTDGTNLDELLIRSGHGFYYPYFPFSKSARFDAAERAAMAARKGLWGHCHPTPTDSGGYVSNNQA
jgi:micrococcal nuclease